MAIGSLGIKHMVKSGAKLTIYLTVGLDILQCFFDDQYTLASLIGNVASDLAKIGIGSIMSAIVGLLAGTFITIAAVPIAVTIGVGVLTGLGLEELDTQYGLTSKLVAKLEEYSQDLAKKKEALEQKMGRTLHEAERELIWRYGGIDINNPLGLR